MLSRIYVQQQLMEALFIQSQEVEGAHNLNEEIIAHNLHGFNLNGSPPFIISDLLESALKKS